MTIDKNIFFSNLSTAQKYCEQQLQRSEKSEQTVLRSCIVGGVYVKSMSRKEWSEKADPYNSETFVELFRGQLAYKKQETYELERDVQYQGKILVIEYGLNIPDGAAEVETGGVFDEFDFPPIDTWFYNGYYESSEGVLFAWIPARFVGYADKAIDVQFLDILHWFKKPSGWV